MTTPTMRYPLTIDRKCIDEEGNEIPVGTIVGYKAHVSGGMLRVVLPDGRVTVINPLATKELRG